MDSFQRLIFIMDKLRLDCPWDKKQTFESLRNLTIEETYELADAILERGGYGIPYRTKTGFDPTLANG